MEVHIMADEEIDHLVHKLKNPSWEIRLSAASDLGETGDIRAVDPLITTLIDPSNSVREFALEALGKLGDKRAVEPLISALSDPDSNVRWQAAKALGQIRDPRAVEPMLAALKNPDVNVRWGAMKALGVIRDHRAVEPLIVALSSQEVWVRRVAAEALGELGNTCAITPLRQTLQDEEWWVRIKAVGALEKLNWKPNTPIEQAYSLIFNQAWGKLVALGLPAVKPLLHALHDEDIAETIIEVLIQIGFSDIEPLVQILDDDKLMFDENYNDVTPQFSHIVNLLTQMGDVKAIEPLTKMLDRLIWFESAQYTIIEALSTIGNTRVVEFLTKAFIFKQFRNNDFQRIDIENEIATILKNMGENAVPTLVQVMQDADESHKKLIAEILQHVGSPAIEYIYPRLYEENEETQKNTLDILHILLHLEDNDFQIIIFDTIQRIGVIRKENLLNQVLLNEAEKMDIRIDAATILGMGGDPRGVKWLLPILEDEDTERQLQTKVAKALGKIGDPETLPSLINALEYGHVYVAEGLGMIGDKRAIDPLLTELEY